MMKKYINISTFAVLMVAAVMSASGQEARWNGNAGDGMWTNAANWINGFVPTLTNDTANWTGKQITLNAPGYAYRFWSRGGLGDNVLTITNNGILTTADDIALNEFSSSEVFADLVIEGGAAIVSNNLAVAGQPTSQGGGRVFLNSGTIDVLRNVKIGTEGIGVGVDGEVTVNGGVFTVLNRTILGGGDLATDTGTLIINGGLYTEGTNGSAFQIGVGTGSGAVEMNGGVLVNNNALEMDVDASNDVGTASIAFNGGEFWQMDPSVTIQDESTLSFQEGVLYWSSNQVAALTDLVASSNVTYVLGRTNMLTTSWDAVWTNGFTLDYGYWSKSYGSALYADVDDVTNGYTTVWAMNLSPDVLPPVSNGVAETHTFNNNSGDQLWTTGANWDMGTVPTLEDTANHTANSDTLVIDNTAAAAALNVWNNSTATVAVVQYGSLSVGGDVVLGNGDSAGVGVLKVDGGDVNIGGAFSLSKYGTDTRKGIGVLNSGTISVGGETLIGGGGLDTSIGDLTINGGPYTANQRVRVGETGAGTLTVNGGTLSLPKEWGPGELVVGNGSADGLFVLNGGSVSVSMFTMNTDGAGTARAEINGGVLDIRTPWSDGTFNIENVGAELFIGGGVVTRSVLSAGPLTLFTNAVENGFVTWDTTNSTMLTQNWEVSYTNGTGSILFVDYDDVYSGKTTMWAYSPPAPINPPEMSIAVGTGGLDVMVSNLDWLKSYQLQSSPMLTVPGWTAVGTTSGVSSATWNVPASQAVEFFQVQELVP